AARNENHLYDRLLAKRDRSSGSVGSGDRTYSKAFDRTRPRPEDQAAAQTPIGRPIANRLPVDWLGFGARTGGYSVSDVPGGSSLLRRLSVSLIESTTLR